MLELTGTIDDKTYSSEIVSADFLIDTFGLKMNGERTLRFELNTENPRVVSRSRAANNQERHAVGWSLKTFINGFYKGNNVQVRYYTSRIPRADGKDARYTPDKITYDGRTKTYDLQTQREEAVFLALHPFHEASPLRNPSRHESIFRIANLVGRAQATIDGIAQKRKITEIILNAPDDLAVFTAMGFQAGLESVNQEEARHPTTAKAGLLKLAEKLPVEVLSAFESHKVQTTGAVMYAMHMGYIEKRTVAGGRFSWRWSAEKGGTEIITTQPRREPVGELADHLNDREVWNAFQEKILPKVKNSKAEAKKVIEEAQSLVDAGPSDQEILQRAIEDVIVTLHPKEDKVYILNDRQQIEGRALMILEGPREGWKEEFKERANTILINRIKSRLS